MEKDFHKMFDKCPACGSEHQFFKELAQELKDRGLARPNWTACFEAKSGVLIDPSREMLLPIGITLPGFTFRTDICVDCGTVYAVELQRMDGVTGLRQQPSKDLPPGLYRSGN